MTDQGSSVMQKPSQDACSLKWSHPVEPIGAEYREYRAH